MWYPFTVIDMQYFRKLQIKIHFIWVQEDYYYFEIVSFLFCCYSEHWNISVNIYQMKELLHRADMDMQSFIHVYHVDLIVQFTSLHFTSIHSKHLAKKKEEKMMRQFT